jgi:hypothetical protein
MKEVAHESVVADDAYEAGIVVDWSKALAELSQSGLL